MKCDHSRIRRAGSASPSNPLIGNLLRDLGIEVLFLAADICTPIQVLVVKLPDFENAIHKAWKFFELSPLVVGCSRGHIYVNRFFDGRHFRSLLIPPLEYTNAKALPYCVSGAEQTRAIEKKIIA